MSIVSAASVCGKSRPYAALPHRSRSTKLLPLAPDMLLF
jgi:hypothetical protein